MNRHSLTTTQVDANELLELRHWMLDVIDRELDDTHDASGSMLRTLLRVDEAEVETLPQWLSGWGYEPVCVCGADADRADPRLRQIAPLEAPKAKPDFMHSRSNGDSGHANDGEGSGIVCVVHDYHWGRASRDVCVALETAGKFRYRAAVGLKEDLNRLQAWRRKKPDRMLLVEIPPVLAVIHALLVLGPTRDADVSADLGSAAAEIGGRLRMVTGSELRCSGITRFLTRVGNEGEGDAPSPWSGVDDQGVPGELAPISMPARRSKGPRFARLRGRLSRLVSRVGDGARRLVRWFGRVARRIWASLRVPAFVRSFGKSVWHGLRWASGAAGRGTRAGVRGLARLLAEIRGRVRVPMRLRRIAKRPRWLDVPAVSRRLVRAVRRFRWPSRQWWIAHARSPRTITLAFGGLVSATVLARYLVLASGGAPATIDSGNWLAFAESLLSDSPRDSSIVYPPVVPLLAELSTGLFGMKHGVAILGALSAAAPAVGLYTALRLAGVGPLRVVPAVLLLGAGSIGEATAWGGFPQLLAMAIVPNAVIFWMRFLTTPSPRSAFVLGSTLMLLLATSHFVAAVVVVAMAASAVMETLSTRSWAIKRLHLGLLPYVLVPCALLFGTYAKIVNAVIFNPNEFAALDNLTWGNALSRLNTIYSDFPALWQILVPLALVTPLLTWTQRNSVVWRLSTSSMLSVLALLLVTSEGRYLYLVPLVAACSLAVWERELLDRLQFRSDNPRVRSGFRLGIAAAVLLLAMQLEAGLSRFDEQRDFYAVLSPGLVEAVEAADAAVESAPRSGANAIAIPALNDAPVGWWVEALTDETVLYGSPLRWLNFGDEVERAEIANSVFHPKFPDGDSLRMLANANVRAVVLPTRWAWYDEATVDQWISDNRLVVAERNDDAIVLDLG